jgi:hypothetical protein
MWPYAGPEPEYRLINWTTLAPSAGFGATAVYNFEESVMSNVTWPLGDAQFGAIYDFEAGIGAVVDPITPDGAGIWSGTRVRVADMKTGDLLWDKTVEETNYSPMCALADHGKVAFLTMDGYWMAFNVNDGSLAWKSDVMDYPWDAPGFGAYASASAYGLFYRNAYSGVYAFDWDDGSIVWKFEAKTPHQFETPYVTTDGEGVYSFNGGGLIVDGKYYVYNTEHTPTSPLTRGWKLYCLDATTGEQLWDITGSIPVGSTFGGSGAAAVADGYLIGTSTYDGYMYCFGKGKSQTTVTAPDAAVPKGTAITIKGSVLDLSPAQPNTPCVSADSMTTQMQYLHMQHPVDGVAHNEMITGVPVILTAYDESGNFVDIGTVVSDGYYGSYGMSWTPDEEGTYKITANFAGDDSYGSSGASTYVTVGPAPSAGGTIEPEHPLISTEVALAIAVIAIVAIGAVAYVFLRRQK